MNILITLIILSIIIFIHELGHFLTAKLFKMPVSEFAMGMGPKLVSYKAKETLYSIRGVPMGGFVNIEGMDIDNPVENGFNTKPAWQRFVVLFAGVFMNFLLAFVIVFPFTIMVGKVVPVEKSIIGYIDEKAPSAKYLMIGDEILEMGGQKINNWEDVAKVSAEQTDEDLTIKILRDNKEMRFDIKLMFSQDRSRYLIGINQKFELEKYKAGEGIKAGFQAYFNVFKQIFFGFKMMVTGQVKADQIAGPVGLVKIVDSFAKEGLMSLVGLTALLSVNIGIFNLFPLPALDGGRIIFVLLELIGMEVNKKTEEKIHTVGIIILLGLFVLITGNDLKNLFIK